MKVSGNPMNESRLMAGVTEEWVTRSTRAVHAPVAPRGEVLVDVQQGGQETERQLQDRLVVVQSDQQRRLQNGPGGRMRGDEA